MIITRTPLRISLVGGGTDLASFYEKDPKQPGFVVSFAINKYVYVILNSKFENDIRVSYSQTEEVDFVHEINHDIIREALRLVRIESGIEVVTVADIPGGGTGLGSSSSLAVGLVKALNQYVSGPVEDRGALAELAYLIEHDKCHKSVGKQDHYAAAYGGFNRIKFKKGMAEVKEIKSHWDSEYPWSLNDLNQGLLLLWTGNFRQAESILKEQSRNMSSGKGYSLGREMASLAENMADELMKSEKMPLFTIGTFLDLNWEYKRQLHPNISDTQIDEWYQNAMRAGAYGGKLCGAGGGGFMLFCAEPDKHKGIIQATGLRPVSFKITLSGSEVVNDDGDRKSRGS